MSEKMSEKISVIVPVYNLEKYIRATVKSICNQTYRNLEIILVNDGSSDNSYKIMNELAHEDQRIKCIDQENGGVTKARLTGVAAATGEWITFVDGDDEIAPDMYERLLSNAYKYNADISHCGFQMCFSDGRVKYFYNTNNIVKQDNISGLKDLLSGDFVEPGLCNKLYNKKMFNDIIENNVIDLSIKNNEDLLMNYILFSKAACSIYEDFCPYYYQIREQSASRGKITENKIYDPIKVKEIICNIACEEMKNYALIAYISTCINSYNSLISIKDRRNDLINVRKLIKSKKKQFNLLGNKRRLLAELICMCPTIYYLFYSLYSKYLQDKKYS